MKSTSKPNAVEMRTRWITYNSATGKIDNAVIASAIGVYPTKANALAELPQTAPKSGYIWVREFAEFSNAAGFSRRVSPVAWLVWGSTPRGVICGFAEEWNVFKHADMPMSARSWFGKEISAALDSDDTVVLTANAPIEDQLHRKWGAPRHTVTQAQAQRIERAILELPIEPITL